MTVRRTVLLAAISAGALLFTASPAAAQRRTTRRPARRPAPIEIRGQVPTPQVVTVRPRAVPSYSRRVLVPDFYDRSFWPSILPAYQLVPQRTLAAAPDSAPAPASPPADAPPATPPANPPAADSAAPPPSSATPPARVPR